MLHLHDYILLKVLLDTVVRKAKIFEPKAKVKSNLIVMLLNLQNSLQNVIESALR